MAIRAVCLICVLLTIIYSREKAGANQFVSHLYSNYENNRCIDYSGSGADTIFSPELLKLIKADLEKSKEEVGYLNGDPICDCQEFYGFKMENMKIIRKMELTYAEVKFKIGSRERKVTLELRELNEKWLIYDIIYDKKESLFNKLTEDLENRKSKEK